MSKVRISTILHVEIVFVFRSEGVSVNEPRNQGTNCHIQFRLTPSGARGREALQDPACWHQDNVSQRQSTNYSHQLAVTYCVNFFQAQLVGLESLRKAENHKF